MQPTFFGHKEDRQRNDSQLPVLYDFIVKRHNAKHTHYRSGSAWTIIDAFDILSSGTSRA
jgi:hypothetical protein